jgi:hypothetical protein
MNAHPAYSKGSGDNSWTMTSFTHLPDTLDGHSGFPSSIDTLASGGFDPYPLAFQKKLSFHLSNHSEDSHKDWPGCIFGRKTRL